MLSSLDEESKKNLKRTIKIIVIFGIIIGVFLILNGIVVSINELKETLRIGGF